MPHPWTRNGKLVLFLLPVLLGIVVVPVLFVKDNYSTLVGWLIIELLICFILLFQGISIVIGTKERGAYLKNREVGVFFILSVTVIACSASGYADTQATLDRMQFTTLVDHQPVDILAGSQAWNYAFAADNYDDLLIKIVGYASAPCPTNVKLQFTWTVYQDGTYLYGGDVRKFGGVGCEEDNTSDRTTRISLYAWNFKETNKFNISITFSCISFPENNEESISFTIYGTTNFSRIWFGAGELRLLFGTPLVICTASVILAILGIIHIERDRLKKRRQASTETVWKSSPSTPDRDLQDDGSNPQGSI
ncbi:MAG: hypothetical protein Q6373_013020 [Candidatus Sigynarchaeota archaeon]